MEKNAYIELAECLLPEEMIEYFEVVKVDKTGACGRICLRGYLFFQTDLYEEACFRFSSRSEGPDDRDTL